jgi:hypothetical protein
MRDQLLLMIALVPIAVIVYFLMYPDEAMKTATWLQQLFYVMPKPR